jgi:predicted metalloprotease
VTKIRSRNASHIQDRRGQTGAGGSIGGLDSMLRGGGIRLPGGGSGGFGPLLKGGGGLAGILVLLAVIVLPKLMGGASAATSNVSQPGSGAASVSESGSASVSDTCSTDLEQQLCGATEDVQNYWNDQLPRSFGIDYEYIDTVFFSGTTGTGCGTAQAEMGPFYCPADHLVYLDLDFLTKLENEFVGSTSDLATQYVIAHEYGHHVQNLIGVNEQVQQASRQDPSRANQYSVALELQADCFAGAWARDASDRNLFDAPNEVQEAIDAAAGVGDDAIQQQVQGRVDPDQFTHGTSAQRVQWFRRGYDTGDPQRCTTFSEVL